MKKRTLAKTLGVLTSIALAVPAYGGITSASPAIDDALGRPSRPLTHDEAELLKVLYPDTVDTDRVRIVARGDMDGLAGRVGSTTAIQVPADRVRDDGTIPELSAGLLAHEAMHIHQIETRNLHERGGFLRSALQYGANELLPDLVPSPYDIDEEMITRHGWEGIDIEAQAEAVEAFVSGYWGREDAPMTEDAPYADTLTTVLGEQILIEEQVETINLDEPVALPHHDARSESITEPYRADALEITTHGIGVARQAEIRVLGGRANAEPARPGEELILLHHDNLYTPPVIRDDAALAIAEDPVLLAEAAADEDHDLHDALPDVAWIRVTTTD